MWKWDKTLPYWEPDPGCADPRCAWCGKANWLIRWWHFFDRARNDPLNQPHLAPYRCDVSIKCLVCGQVLSFGLIVPVAWWEEHHIHHGYHMTWQQARRENLL